MQRLDKLASFSIVASLPIDILPLPFPPLLNQGLPSTQSFCTLDCCLGSLKCTAHADIGRTDSVRENW